MTTPVARSLSPSSRSVGFLHFQFLLTGIVTALVGPLLALLIKRCSMSDAEAGLLIAAQFGGNFLGSFFARRNLRRSVLIGMIPISIGVPFLGFIPCRWATWVASLRNGFLVPASTLGLILVLSLMGTKELRAATIRHELT